jgi:anti-anti-sigma factor
VVLIVGSSAANHESVARRLQEAIAAHVVVAPDGRAAIASVALEQPDLVLTELELADMHAARMVRAIRRRHPFLPHMVIAPHYDSAGGLEVLRAGASRCLSATDPEGIADAVVSCLRASVGFRQWDELRGCWRGSELRFVIANEPRQIAGLVGYLQRNAALVRALDETATFELGVALHEALRNAVEHGNLEVGREIADMAAAGAAKGLDLDELASTRRRLVRERLTREPYRSRHVTVIVEETAAAGQYRILDEGPGFDAAGHQYDPTSSDNIVKPWGRGLFLVRSLMDEVSWNPAGNEITMVHRHPRKARTEEPKDQIMQFKIQKSEDDLMRVDVAGEMVRGASPVDDDPLTDVIGDGVYGRRVLLNLRHCRHIDSTGIGYLLTCHQRFERQGGRLVLHSAPAAVARLFQVMRVHQVLHITADAAGAARLAEDGQQGVQHHEQ